ncbi:hypothetical protein [Mesorhizobium sp.]|uniref:hypothetical protein n=2 Tax=Mesorhizobium sp. TaxID=1871066 RepID=UPI0025F746EC|nr:hypothetical protein [Mesorhizobium sp.]
MKAFETASKGGQDAIRMGDRKLRLDLGAFLLRHIVGGDQPAALDRSDRLSNAARRPRFDRLPIRNVIE